MAGLYFFYGLSFFVLGLVLLIRDVPNSLIGLRAPFRLFGCFGLLHSVNEWLVMAHIAGFPFPQAYPGPTISFFGGASFLVLLIAGLSFILPDNEWRKTKHLLLPTTLGAIWLVLFFGGISEIFPATLDDIFSRWVIGAPGTFLVGIGLLSIGSHSTANSKAFSFKGAIETRSLRYKPALRIAGAAICLYGLSTFFGPALDVFPATIINAEIFENLFGVAVQVPRTILAFILAVVMVFWLRGLQKVEFEEMENTIQTRTKELHVLNENLNNALQMAERANQAKSDFLASMSHELRTPLNAILGFAQFVKIDPQNPLAARQHENIDHIIDGGEHLLELVNDLLDLARIEADRVELSIRELDISDIINDCLTLAKPLGSDKSIRWETSPSTSPANLVRSDKMRLKQVLINFLSNAIKYNRKNGSIRLDQKITPTGFLRVSVTDTGYGIPREKLKDVFNMFQRLEHNPLVAQEGSGIGLTVSKLLIDRLGGRIGAESTVEVGSTFWFEVPLSTNDEIVIWENFYSIGIDAIDKDHQKLVLLLNKTAHQDLTNSEINEIILDLVRYTQYHFSREETLMESIGFPELNAHRKQHWQLLKAVEQTAGNWFRQQSTETLNELRTLLRKWLTKHICESDRTIQLFIEASKNTEQSDEKQRVFTTLSTNG